VARNVAPFVRRRARQLGLDERAVVAGDAVLIPPGMWHDIVGGGQGVRFLCLCVPPYSDEDTYFA